MLTKWRSHVLVWIVVAGLAACASPASVQAPAPQKGVNEPFFVQSDRMAAKRAVIDSGAPIDLLFIGDSITQNYEKTDYLPVWNKYFAPHHALNLGYGLDTTGATLWRFRQGELKGLDPKITVILIGTNDTNLGRSSDQTFAGVVSVVGEVEKRLPNTHILLIGILPSARSEEKSRADLDVNARLSVRYGSYVDARFKAQPDADRRVTYLGLAKTFLHPVGLNTALYIEQPPEMPLHPNPEGQEAMAKAVQSVLLLMSSNSASPKK